MLLQLGELGVVLLAGQGLGAGHQLLQTQAVLGLGAGLHVVGRQGVFGAVQHTVAGLGFELLQRGGFSGARFALSALKPRAQGVDGGCR